MHGKILDLRSRMGQTSISLLRTSCLSEVMSRSLPKVALPHEQNPAPVLGDVLSLDSAHLQDSWPLRKRERRPSLHVASGTFEGSELELSKRQIYHISAFTLQHSASSLPSTANRPAATAHYSLQPYMTTQPDTSPPPPHPPNSPTAKQHDRTPTPSLQPAFP